MTEADRTLPTIAESRRTFMTYVASGAALGTAGTAGARGDESDTNEAEQPAARGIMFPYQFVPGSAAEVDARDVDWQPKAIADADRTYSTHVLSYGLSSPYQAFLFVPDGETLPETEDGRLRLGDRMATPEVDAGRSLVAVDVDARGE